MKQVIASVLLLLVLGLAPHEAHAYCTTPAPVWSDLHPVRIVIHPEMQNYLRHAYHGPDLVENNMRSCTTSADCGTDGLCVTGYTTAPVNRCRGPRWTRGELERAVQWVVSRINQDSGANLPLVYVDTNGTSSCSLVDDCGDSARPWMNCFQSDTIVLIPSECDPVIDAGMDTPSATRVGDLWADWGDWMQRNKLIRVASSNSRDNDPRLGTAWSHYRRAGVVEAFSLAQNFEMALLHELGHALGLGHVANDYPSSVPNCIPNTTSGTNSVCPEGGGSACAVMGSCSSCGEGRAVHLHSYGYDDMQGLVALYGLESTADTRLFEDWDLSTANFGELSTADLPIVTNIAAGAVPATSASTAIVGGRFRDALFMERFRMYEWNWLDFSSTLRTTAWIPTYRSTGPIAVSVSPTHRILSSHAMRLTNDARRYRRRIVDVRDVIAGGGYGVVATDHAAGAPGDTSVPGVSAAYHPGTGATVHVTRDDNGQILIQAYGTYGTSFPPSGPTWSNVIATGVYSFAHPSIACSPNRCFIAFTEMPFPASTSRETRLQWMEGTFTWGAFATSFEWTNLSGVNTTWNNITSDPVASVVYNPSGGWYFYVAVALPARIGSVWGSRVYVYRRAEASAGALSLMLPQVADFPGVFVQPAAAGAGGYAEVFTSSSF